MIHASLAGPSRSREVLFDVDSYSRNAILSPAMRRDAIFALLVSGFLGFVVLAGCRREETHDERRMRFFREDFKVCDRFAIKREEARELLAYNPELTAQERDRERKARGFRSTRESMEDVTRRWDADRRACLRGRDWKDEWIDDMTAKMRAEDKAKEKKEPWMR